MQRYLLSILSFLLFVNCTCIGEATIADACKDYNLVCMASVIKVDRKEVYHVNPLINDSIKYTYKEFTCQLVKRFKGDGKKEVKLYSNVGSTVCGVDLVVGENYLIFANEEMSKAIDGKSWWVNSCSPTQVYTDSLGVLVGKRFRKNCKRKRK